MSESIFDNMDKKANSFLTNAFLAILVSLVRPIATLTEIFFRRQMGERYFTAWNIVGGLLVVSVFCYPEFGFDPYNKQGTVKTLATIWAICLLAYGVWNYIEKYNRYKEGRVWHSYNYGLPWIDKFGILFEKGLPLGLGVALYYFEFRSIGTLLVLSVMVSLWLRYREIQLFREHMLNAIDSRIEHENFSKAFNENRPPQETQGLMAHPPKGMSKEMRENLSDV